MNTSHFKSFAVLATAAVAVLGAALLAATDAPKTEIVQLERVVIVGKRMSEVPVVVAQLPRVVITGRSAADTRLAAASTAKPAAL